MVQFTWPRWMISGLVLGLVACAGVGIGVSEPAETGNQVQDIEPVEMAQQAAAATPLPTSTHTHAPTATTASVPATATPAETPAVAEAPEPAVQEPAAPAPAPALTGPTEEQARLLASLPAKGLAPELVNEVWLNSEPLKLADLRGKVVIVEFWTFG